MKKNHVFAISIVSVLCVLFASLAMFGCDKPKPTAQEIPAATISTTDATPIPVVTPPMTDVIAPEAEMSLDATPVVVPTVPVVDPAVAPVPAPVPVPDMK